MFSVFPFLLSFFFFFNHKTRGGSCGSRWAEQWQKPHDTSLRLLGWWRLSGAAFKFWEVRAVSSRTGGARHQHPGFAVSRQPHSPRKPAKVSLQLAREAALLQAGFCGWVQGIRFNRSTRQPDRLHRYSLSERAGRILCGLPGICKVSWTEKEKSEINWVRSLKDRENYY